MRFLILFLISTPLFADHISSYPMYGVKAKCIPNINFHCFASTRIDNHHLFVTCQNDATHPYGVIEMNHTPEFIEDHELHMNLTWIKEDVLTLDDGMKVKIDIWKKCEGQDY